MGGWRWQVAGGAHGVLVCDGVAGSGGGGGSGGGAAAPASSARRVLVADTRLGGCAWSRADTVPPVAVVRCGPYDCDYDYDYDYDYGAGSGHGIGLVRHG